MVTHSAGRVDARPLHGDGDAVEEDDGQNDVVKHLVGDDLIAHDPKPAGAGKTQQAGGEYPIQTETRLTAKHRTLFLKIFYIVVFIFFFSTATRFDDVW